MNTGLPIFFGLHRCFGGVAGPLWRDGEEVEEIEFCQEGVEFGGHPGEAGEDRAAGFPHRDVAQPDGLELAQDAVFPRLDEDGQAAGVQGLLQPEGLRSDEGAPGEGIGDRLADLGGQLGDEKIREKRSNLADTSEPVFRNISAQ
ncbi:hypothetical protein BH23VER1_BH23VER1_20640 [soil metagenome]